MRQLAMYRRPGLAPEPRRPAFHPSNRSAALTATAVAADAVR